MKLRRGKPKWNESDWVITDDSGKALLKLTDEEMRHIVRSYDVLTYTGQDVWLWTPDPKCEDL